MLRPRRKPTNTENDDGDTILNTTFDAGSSQHHPQMLIHTSPLRCPIHATTNWHHQNARNSSTSSACSTTEADNTPYFPSHITRFWFTFITAISSSFYRRQVQFNLRRRIRSGHRSDTDQQKKQANRTFTHNSTTGRPTSTLTTMDYTTQGDPNQVAPSTPLMFMSTTTKNQFLGTNNFFIPDGGDRSVHNIHDKVFHTGYLENGNNTYLLELPGLEKMLHTQKFLMDEMSGQFYTVYSNSYQ